MNFCARWIELNFQTARMRISRLCLHDTGAEREQNRENEVPGEVLQKILRGRCSILIGSFSRLSGCSLARPAVSSQAKARLPTGSRGKAAGQDGAQAYGRRARAFLRMCS